MTGVSVGGRKRHGVLEDRGERRGMAGIGMECHEGGRERRQGASAGARGGMERRGVTGGVRGRHGTAEGIVGCQKVSEGIVGCQRVAEGSDRHRKRPYAYSLTGLTPARLAVLARRSPVFGDEGVRAAGVKRQQVGEHLETLPGSRLLTRLLTAPPLRLRARLLRRWSRCHTA